MRRQSGSGRAKAGKTASPGRHPHLKTKPSGAIEVPLWRNLPDMVSAAYSWRPDYSGDSTSYGSCGTGCFRVMKKCVVKRDAQGNRGRVLKALHKVSDEHLDDAINNEVVPYLNDLLGLPPGTTATELSGKVDDEELANCLKSSGNSSYIARGRNHGTSGVAPEND